LPGDKLFEQEYNELLHERDQLKQAFERLPTDNTDSEYTTYRDLLKNLSDNNIKDLFNTFTEYERTFNERARVYHHFVHENQQEDSVGTKGTSEIMDTFRNDLFQHLAGNIVVKEHRHRY
jgi:hypothetical protein